MEIKTVEHSPFPQIKSIKSTRLIFNKSERKCLARAHQILEKAENMVLDYVKNEWDWPDNFTLSDIDFDLAEYFHGQYHIHDLLTDSFQEGLNVKTY